MSEEKGVWASEAWKTPELLVVVHTGKEKKEEHINRISVRDATVFDVVIQHLGLMKGEKEIVVEVDGKVMNPLEAKKIAAFTVMEIVIHPSEVVPVKAKEHGVVYTAPAYLVDERKYHQHRGIVGGHKVRDKHKEPEAQRYHANEIKYHSAYKEA